MVDVKQTVVDIFNELQEHWCSECKYTCTKKRMFKCFREYVDTAIIIAFEVKENETKNK